MKRVFEFQLMPGVLALKKKTFNVDSIDVYKGDISNASINESDHDVKAVARATIHHHSEESEGYLQPNEAQLKNMKNFIEEGGLDFGDVSIWVCPSSCQASIEEYALVQAPSDF